MFINKGSKMYKQDFDFFQNNKTVYLDNAATTQKPKVVLEAMQDYYTKYCSNTHRSSYESSNLATKKYEACRQKLVGFLHASSNKEVIFTKGVTEALNMISFSYAKEHANTVILSSLEHHSNIVPWHMQGRRLGNGLAIIKTKEALLLDLEHLEELLKKHSNALVSLTHVSNAFGVIHPIKEVCELAHKYSAKVLVDGAQSMPHFALDVQALGVDFYTVSAHKSFGPTGVGALYVKEELLKKLTPYQTGGATISDVSYETTTLLDSPFCFEAGTQNIAGVIGFLEAICFIENIGYERFGTIEKELSAYLYEQLENIDGIIFYADKTQQVGSVSFNVEGINPNDLGILLDKQHIAIRAGHHCAQPIMKQLGIEGTARVSLSIYNDKTDIDAFIHALKRALHMLRG